MEKNRCESASHLNRLTLPESDQGRRDNQALGHWRVRGIDKHNLEVYIRITDSLHRQPRFRSMWERWVLLQRV